MISQPDNENPPIWASRYMASVAGQWLLVVLHRLGGIVKLQQHVTIQSRLRMPYIVMPKNSPEVLIIVSYLSTTSYLVHHSDA